jgi:hypothetical protein
VGDGWYGRVRHGTEGEASGAVASRAEGRSFLGLAPERAIFGGGIGAGVSGGGNRAGGAGLRIWGVETGDLVWFPVSGCGLLFTRLRGLAGGGMWGLSASSLSGSIWRGGLVGGAVWGETAGVECGTVR